MYWFSLSSDDLLCAFIFALFLLLYCFFFIAFALLLSLYFFCFTAFALLLLLFAFAFLLLLFCFFFSAFAFLRAGVAFALKRKVCGTKTIVGQTKLVRPCLFCVYMFKTMFSYILISTPAVRQITNKDLGRIGVRSRHRRRSLVAVPRCTRPKAQMAAYIGW